MPPVLRTPDIANVKEEQRSKESDASYGQIDLLSRLIKSVLDPNFKASTRVGHVKGGTLKAEKAAGLTKTEHQLTWVKAPPIIGPMVILIAIGERTALKYGP